MKLSDVEASKAPLEILLAKDLPIKLAYKLALAKVALVVYFDIIGAKRNEILDKFEKDDKGIIVPGSIDEANALYLSMLDEDIDDMSVAGSIDLDTFPDDITIDANTIFLLSWLFSE